MAQLSPHLFLLLLLSFFLLLSFHVLFSQKGFTYDFEFLQAFLSNKKYDLAQKKWGGDPTFTPKSSFLGGQKACEPFLGGAETERSACAMGKQGPHLAYAIYCRCNHQSTLNVLLKHQFSKYKDQIFYFGLK